MKKFIFVNFMYLVYHKIDLLSSFGPAQLDPDFDRRVNSVVQYNKANFKDYYANKYFKILNRIFRIPGN
ncbi:MAG: hypothetical protein US42_C0008G0072 [Candidatus Magasanikbacteria bacterium GW2011_GWC2_37_14]|uniref:Uncharacterized protein n=1 Tax=Candidatus Magasanikbacteria bacterium GW2011_GWC2_37_14 TaxID=1619046 RepID=A0A0G0JHF7_9BACT|nr:MAG: hypothetical protein US42_C0008G0072 [Candidatus Magasanikbacteria bacterium GW2011_GWC2_37_14]